MKCGASSDHRAVIPDPTLLIPDLNPLIPDPTYLVTTLMDVWCVFFRFLLGELCHSFCPWHITWIDDFEPKRNSLDFWRAGIFVF